MKCLILYMLINVFFAFQVSASDRNNDGYREQSLKQYALLLQEVLDANISKKEVRAKLAAGFANSAVCLAQHFDAAEVGVHIRAVEAEVLNTPDKRRKRKRYDELRSGSVVRLPTMCKFSGK
ncbi:hypothetical protein [Alteromonas antoniana]|uniref:hypothetical protein n=1 Tax=Alteromonas antoniana TaxID=2803813 RepID=UPI001C4651FD|nr:hypothetical protein [Alteromonas antoniana]